MAPIWASVSGFPPDSARAAFSAVRHFGLMLYALTLVAALAGLVALVPLIVWAGTGSWRHALHALREYLSIIVVAVLLVGGLALLITLAGIIDSPVQ